MQLCFVFSSQKRLQSISNWNSMRTRGFFFVGCILQSMSTTWDEHQQKNQIWRRRKTAVPIPLLKYLGWHIDNTSTKKKTFLENARLTFKRFDIRRIKIYNFIIILVLFFIATLSSNVSKVVTLPKLSPCILYLHCNAFYIYIAMHWHRLEIYMAILAPAENFFATNYLWSTVKIGNLEGGAHPRV